jgi:hypothetical protein
MIDYNNLMTTFTVRAPYAIRGPMLETKKDVNKQTFKFAPSHFVVITRDRVRVVGQCDSGIWCAVDYKSKAVPKWLRREMTRVAKDN